MRVSNERKMYKNRMIDRGIACFVEGWREKILRREEDNGIARNPCRELRLEIISSAVIRDRFIEAKGVPSSRLKGLAENPEETQFHRLIFKEKKKKRKISSKYFCKTDRLLHGYIGECQSIRTRMEDVFEISRLR